MSAPLPSITVAVPAFNHAQYVRQALDSVLDSGVPDVEIIICDDASTDDTADIAEAWARENGHRLSRFELIRHQRNTGLCQTLNDIVAAAAGELIHIIASDDYFLPGGLLMKTATMAQHPEWQVAFCDGQAVGLEGQLYLESLVADSPYIPAQLAHPDTLQEELLYHWGPPAHQMTWRRSAYKAHGGRFEYDITVFCEDYDSALWAAGHGVLGYIPKVCQAYRLRSWPQTGNRHPARDFRDNAHVLAKHARLFPPHVRGGMEFLSSIYYHVAIGDNGPVPALWQRHYANRDAYEKRVASPSAPPPEVIDCGTHQQQALMAEIRRLEHEWALTKAQLREANAKIKERGKALSALKEELATTRRRLAYHAANPARALKLWWRQLRQRKN